MVASYYWHHATSPGTECLLHDIYHRQEIIRSGRLPADLVTHNEAFLPKMPGVTPPGNVYTHVVGIDLIARAG